MTAGHTGRSSTLREFARKNRLPSAMACGICAGSLEAGGRVRQDRQHNRAFCRYFTGATGLEPATSGVTGRSWRLLAEREWAGIPDASGSLARCLAGITGRGRGIPAAFCGISAGCDVA
jgi:hypothetical protein